MLKARGFRPRATKDDTFVEFVCDQLADLDAILYKAMFGGYGVYEGSLFFGIVYDGRLYFKTSDTSRERYLAWDSLPFQPKAKQTLNSYYEVPGDLIEDAAELTALAREAIDVVLELR